MRYDTKCAIWWDSYNKHLFIFYIKHLSTILRTLQIKKMVVEKPNVFFSFCEVNATKFGSKSLILHTIIYHYMTSYG